MTLNHRTILENRRGFTYIALLAAIVIIGISLGAAGRYWSNVTAREKEEELLFRGEQYVAAIRSYYVSGAHTGVQPRLTPNIEDLLKDTRFNVPKRHLRRKYKDPITEEDFILLRDRRTRAIVGVRSKSDKEPLKKNGFPVRDIPELNEMYRTFEGKTKYSDWRFIFTPPLQPIRGHPPTAGPVPPPLPIEIIDDTEDQGQ